MNNIIDRYEVIDYNEGDCDKYSGKEYSGKCKIYYKNGLIHRDNDLPAYIQSYKGCIGELEWDYTIYTWYEHGYINRTLLDKNGYTQPTCLNVDKHHSVVSFAWINNENKLLRVEFDKITGEPLPVQINTNRIKVSDMSGYCYEDNLCIHYSQFIISYIHDKIFYS